MNLLNSNTKNTCPKLLIIEFFYIYIDNILKNLIVHLRIYTDSLTSQNSCAIGTSLSEIIFNLVSLLKNEWTPPLHWLGGISQLIYLL